MLPWNTTKTGVDSDSPIYMAVRQVMISMMRPVIDFNNQLAAEKSQESTPLSQVVEDASARGLDMVSSSSSSAVFIAPHSKAYRIESGMRQIQYSRHQSEVDKVKKSLGARSLKEVGEMTFDHYLTSECGE